MRMSAALLLATLACTGCSGALLESRNEAPEVYRDASPITWVDEETVPFLILQGAAGDPAVEHSRLMTDALHEAGVEVVYGEFPRTDHLGIIAWELMGPETLAFLGRHLHPER